MRQTLFYIPPEIAGIPVFGFGLVLLVWVLGWIAYLAWGSFRGQGKVDLIGNLPIVVVGGLIIAFGLPMMMQTEGIPIRGFGLMLLLATIAGVGLAAHQVKKLGWHSEVIYSLAIWLFVGGIVGARLFYVIQYWEEYARPTWQETLLAVFQFTEGGIVMYGSLIGASLALFLFCQRHRLPVLPLCDVIAPSLVVGLALGRIGCFLNGCCYGGVCELPWAVTFPAGSPAFVRQVSQGELSLYGMRLKGNWEAPPVIEEVDPDSLAAEKGIESGDRLLSVNGQAVTDTGSAAYLLWNLPPGGTIQLTTQQQGAMQWELPEQSLRSRPVHPTQLYSSISASLLALFLWSYYPYRRRDGEVLALLLTMYPISRILLESIRTDELPEWGWGMALTISQLVSVIILLVVSGLWVYLWQQPKGSRYRPVYAGAFDPSQETTSDADEPTTSAKQVKSEATASTPAKH
ncbi:Phosphatidylglycerol--prolipoprotein diacylglyceryl transferase [Planctomycetales bacterium 10988]|nr:Phosphatidylglycerol--prolipoprotein diacylglyceryl transferase [Planctomycetales bacterium 10988]